MGIMARRRMKDLKKKKEATTLKKESLTVEESSEKQIVRGEKKRIK